MNTNNYTSNGWDLIAATTQDSMNKQLSKLPEIVVDEDFTIPAFGLDIPCNVDIVLSAPKLETLELSGKQVNIIFPIKGIITMGTEKIILQSNQKVIITTQLLQIKADIDPLDKDENKTRYHLIIDFKNKDAIVNIKLDLPNAELIALRMLLTKVIQDKISKKHKYPIASFNLSNDTTKNLKALIPHTADFSFVRDKTNPGRSNLLILMLTINNKVGNTNFDVPLLPDNQDYMVLVSNEIFMRQYILPSLIDEVKKQAKNPDKVFNEISCDLIDRDNYLYKVSNSKSINIKGDHHPWIETISTKIDTDKKALKFHIDGRANVTIADIHVKAWDKSWQQFRVDTNEKITLIEIKEDKNSSSHMEWWKWLIAILMGPMALIVTAVINAVVSAKKPNLGGTFADVGKNLIQWPNQKKVKLKEIESPNHLVIFVDVD